MPFYANLINVQVQYDRFLPQGCPEVHYLVTFIISRVTATNKNSHCNQIKVALTNGCQIYTVYVTTYYVLGTQYVSFINIFPVLC